MQILWLFSFSCGRRKAKRRKEKHEAGESALTKRKMQNDKTPSVRICYEAAVGALIGCVLGLCLFKRFSTKTMLVFEAIIIDCDAGNCCFA